VLRAVAVIVLGLAAAAAAATPAAAHVEIVPGVLQEGAETSLRVELPRLRPGPPPTSLELVGARVVVRSVSGPERHGTETRWRVRLLVEAEPGPLPLVLRARFPDGRVVEVRQTVTVVPERVDGRPSFLLAGAAGLLLAAALGAAVLRRARRR